ncbi:MAG TPA: DUF5606 domain-containing protein [Cytophagaceae bacterium]|jgi:hypothetical protein|nr:DUF5606 domain-containing protein [Cytophagaceae bacterium]
MELREIAAVTGRGGLFKIVQPTRTGVILESIDSNATRLVANGNDRVSILNEISIYTTDADGSKPLEAVLQSIKSTFDADLPVTPKSSPEELKAFMSKTLPEYDENRVYVSDIKKLVAWYLILHTAYPELLSTQKEETKDVKKEQTEKPEEAEDKPAKKKVAAKKTAK